MHSKNSSFHRQGHRQGGGAAHQAQPLQRAASAERRAAEAEKGAEMMGKRTMEMKAMIPT